MEMQLGTWQRKQPVMALAHPWKSFLWQCTENHWRKTEDQVWHSEDSYGKSPIWMGLAEGKMERSEDKRQFTVGGTETDSQGKVIPRSLPCKLGKKDFQ